MLISVLMYMVKPKDVYLHYITKNTELSVKKYLLKTEYALKVFLFTLIAVHFFQVWDENNSAKFFDNIEKM